ncbi:hypothetical protein MUA04_02865 [Enterobacteriaceae bacterium H11S18]|uniref:hypothetical protein n=1 Tax=Dryocola clanedunensis TaxID=2925396 RepID=UPI0022F05952|nr:hypothetical protein [Dryocola clanedunensis]MCT4709140.1 hypothetical protein [Dryocola clanedunensis]
MKKSELENDAIKLLDSLNDDYVIPSSWAVIRPILKFMSVVYVMHLLALVLECVVYPDVVTTGAFLFILAIMFVSCIVLTGFAFLILYSNVNILLCINKDVLGRSLIAGIARRMIKRYFFAMIIFNIISAVVIVFVDKEFIVGYGASWFFSYLIAGISFSTSFNRYMTPAVTATFSKIGEFLSSTKGDKSVA